MTARLGAPLRTALLSVLLFLTAVAPALAAESRLAEFLGKIKPGDLVEEARVVLHTEALGRSEAIQITSNLRKNPAYETTLIIGLASEDEAAPEKLTEYGFSEVFKKPFDVALLGERIRTLADAKRDDM